MAPTLYQVQRFPSSLLQFFSPRLNAIVASTTQLNISSLSFSTTGFVFDNKLANKAGKVSLANLPVGKTLFTSNNGTFVLGPLEGNGETFFIKITVNFATNTSAIEVDRLDANGKLVTVTTLNQTLFQNLPRPNAAVFDAVSNQIDLFSNGQNNSATGAFVIISLKDGSILKNGTITYPDTNFTQILGGVLVDSKHVGLILGSTNTSAGIVGVADLSSGTIANFGQCPPPCNIIAIAPRNGLSPALLAIIIVAVIVGVAIIGSICACIVIRRRRRQNAAIPIKD